MGGGNPITVPMEVIAEEAMNSWVKANAHTIYGLISECRLPVGGAHDDFVGWDSKLL